MDVTQVNGKEYRYPMLPMNVCILKGMSSLNKNISIIYESFMLTFISAS